MSTSSDSCDLQIRVESSKLVPLFEAMQSIGFPLHILERIVPRIKKGAPSVGFMIYTYIYRTFQDMFEAKNIHLDELIVNEKVIDREKFARSFFKGLREIIQHEQALPLYQYICPGHPLAKVDEIVRITAKLRILDAETPEPVISENDADNLQQLKLDVAERLAHATVRDSFSSNKSVYGSTTVSEKSHSQVIRPAGTRPVDIPWQAVRETLASAGNSDSDDEQSPDEGIRSWNTSSLNRTPVLLKDSRPGEWKKSPADRGGVVMAHNANEENGIHSVLEKFEQIESLQNLKFRSIEERLIRIEHDLVDNNARFERNIGSRLDNHEVRIQHLERTAPTQDHTRKPSVYAAPTGDTQPPPRPRSSSKQSNDSAASFRHRSMSRESHATGDRVMEQGRSLVPSRAMSVSRSFGGEKDLRDSGFSSTHNTADALRQDNWNSIYEMRMGSASPAYGSQRDRSQTIEAPSAANDAPFSTYFTAGTTGPTPEPTSSLRKDSHTEPERKSSVSSRRDSRASEAVRRESHDIDANAKAAHGPRDSISRSSVSHEGHHHRESVSHGNHHRESVSHGSKHRESVSHGNPHREGVLHDSPHRDSVSLDKHHRESVSHDNHHRESVSRGSQRNSVSHADRHRESVSRGDHHPPADIPVVSIPHRLHQSSSTHDLSAHAAPERRESRLQRAAAEHADDSPRESSADSQRGRKGTLPGRAVSGSRPGSRVDVLLENYAEQREIDGEKRKESRHRSVGPSGHTYRMSLPKSEDSGDPLLDLNERIQLRLRERIKTAEDTLNACIETIRRDYVLLRRH
ncbi:uncharacterized protein LOC129589366 isoform X2 [Paramacrobiotus metropolitanus]|uniref:uncharacterized protein LOC129589366 isoform X2 n=1 Tax=Paramacrobiotus metropolitanus TaxID=2943436 RepID=UPI002445A1BC|nr:uncharacterized protein LOC129589366 isoform X2 [Paramacrobiotus metropolitanus]